MKQSQEPEMNRSSLEKVSHNIQNNLSEKLQLVQENYRSLFDNMSEGVAYCRMIFDGERPLDFIYLAVNSAFETQTGLQNVIGKRVTEVIPGIRESDSELFEIYGAVALSGEPRRFETYVKALDDWFDVSVYSPETERFIAVFDVITERKREENAKQAMVDLLKLINSADDRKVLLKSVSHYLKKWSGCEAVGIRLKDGDDFPYFETSGFPEAFVRLESHLCAYDENGEVKRDAEGNPMLDCMCGNILQGRFDPGKSFFTADGSFWSNCTTELLATTSDADRQARTRNRCNGEGYESVALIPLRSGEQTLGLIQFNDHRKGCFTEKSIALYQWIADNIAAFLAKKETENELRVSREQMKAIFDASPAAIFSFDTEGRVLTWNPAAESIFGWPDSEIIGRPIPIIPPDKRDEWHALNRRILAGESLSDLEVTRMNKDGRQIPLKVSTAPIYDKDGASIGVMAVALDLSERKRAEDALRESEAKIRSIIDNIAIGVSLISPDMKILELNRQMREWFPGIHLAEHPTCYQAFNDPPRDRVCDYCPTCKSLQDGRVHESESETPQPGGVRNYRIVSSPLFNAKGEVTASIEMVEDITERRSLEEQLHQAQKLESVGRLAGGVAHDFNNMLSIIIGYGEDLLDQLHDADPLRQSAEEIVKAGKRSAALTRQLLAFSRKQTLQPIVLNINDILRNLEKMLKRLIGEDIELTTSFSEGLGHVEVDPAQIEQVIMNLAVNARDAMPQGGKLIIETANVALDETCAMTHASVVPGNYAMLSITDTGCGMDEATKKNVFEPFFTTKEKGKGTGLGLSTVYGIVKQSGGNVWVYSEPGKGTIFKIFLPHSQTDPMPQEPTAVKEDIRFEGSTILVVEDEPSLRKFVERMLEKLQCRVTAAANGGEALLWVEEKGFRPDLLITDVVMPGMSASILVDRLKRIQPDLKVLYMSGYTDTSIVHHGVIDPGTPFIQKPFNLSDLTSKIASLLRQEQKKKSEKDDSFQKH
ncbi:MAG: PAS domain S-box protein [Desulfobacterales bacterium]